MGTFKGTKGKWFINDEEPLKPEDYLEIMVEVESKHFTKVALGAVYDQNDKVGKANAKLIAAAPELLEACEEMWQWIMKQDDWRGEDPKKEWKNIINKATE